MSSTCCGRSPRRRSGFSRVNSCSTFRGCTTPKSGYRSIDVQILRLRRKIEVNPSRPEYIKTERGAGYVFDTRVEVLH